MRERPLILYGWHLSYFTGKVLCYLRYKRIPFDFRQVGMLTLLVRIRRKVGAVVMPVIVTPEGQWVNDSSVIIDLLEARHPASSVVPATPVQRFAACLIEAWGDEWWVPIAMHTRWTYPENYALFERDAGDALLPGWPAFVRKRAAARVAGTLRGMLRSVGVRPAQFAAMDAWTAHMLDLLDAHFAVHSYLFGQRPTIGDFGLVGTFYGHLARDPWPARELVAARPHLRAWVERMANPPAQADLPLLPADAIARTLEPILRVILSEFVPYLEAINAQVNGVLPLLQPGHALRRGLADVEVALGTGGTLRRTALPYTLWMAQRTLDAYRAMVPHEQALVAAWLATLGGERLLQMDIVRLRLTGVRVTPAQ